MTTSQTYFEHTLVLAEQLDNIHFCNLELQEGELQLPLKIRKTIE